ncbi:MAG TPA: HAD-IA family hydrolase [Dictyobacter sp.]|nr:HAD-IA family hydrolase [Dictyobacter sp.]
MRIVYVIVKGSFMIEALVFDFDGLILDTEVPAYQSWQEIYKSYNSYLPLEKWALCIGSGMEAFNPYHYLAEVAGSEIPMEEVRARLEKRHLELIDQQVALPGVEAYIADAKRLGLKLAVASSSPRSWLVRHLTRLRLLDKFDAMACGDEVVNKKPDPELYLKALDLLQVSAERAIALEDSPNGVYAAQTAGIFCVAIPNELTALLSLDHALLRLKSLDEMPLEKLMEYVVDQQQVGEEQKIEAD